MMGQKAGLDREDVVAAATIIADRDGFNAVTPSAVAAELGIRTPSLYYHVEGVDGLRRALRFHAAAVLTSAFQGVRGDAVGLSDADRIKVFAHAYRGFASQHPGLHAALLPAPMPSEDGELADAMAEPVRIIVSELGQGQDLTPEVVHMIRALRSLLFGFSAIESQGGFGLEVDVDKSFDVAVDLMASAISRALRDDD